MDNVTPEQFAESVRSAIGTVNQFYGQIDRLNSMLILVDGCMWMLFHVLLEGSDRHLPELCNSWNGLA